MAPHGAEEIGGRSECGHVTGARPRAKPVCFLKARHTAQGLATTLGAYHLSLMTCPVQDRELVVDLKGPSKYPDMIPRSRQRPDIVLHYVVVSVHVDQVDGPIRTENGGAVHVQHG